MADTKVTALTELTTPAGVDLLYIVDDPAGTPLSRKCTITNLFANAPRIAISGAANATLITGTSYSLTGSNASSAIDISGTWNTTGTPTLIKANVTDTASNAASLLLDLQVGGVSRFNVDKNGNTTWAGSPVLKSAASIFIDSIVYFASTTGAASRAAAGNGFTVGSGYSYGFSSTTGANGAADVLLSRDAANTLALRNSTNAQTFRTYGTYTDASNYRRVAISMTTAGVASIAPEGAGTGASGNVLHISGLPTSNPGPGILWNNAGTVEVGT